MDDLKEMFHRGNKLSFHAGAATGINECSEMMLETMKAVEEEGGPAALEISKTLLEISKKMLEASRRHHEQGKEFTLQEGEKL